MFHRRPTGDTWLPNWGSMTPATPMPIWMPIICPAVSTAAKTRRTNTERIPPKATSRATKTAKPRAVVGRSAGLTGSTGASTSEVMTVKKALICTGTASEAITGIRKSNGPTRVIMIRTLKI